uniref:Uncharacterized protein n=1 Tax=Arundo donax TaxID=35708 RepID=A0A0A9BLX4_ARUDO
MPHLIDNFYKSSVDTSMRVVFYKMTKQTTSQEQARAF